MARTPDPRGASDMRPMRPRRRFSGWTVVVPLALAACIYVVASILGSTRWTIGRPAHARPRRHGRPFAWCTRTPRERGTPGAGRATYRRLDREASRVEPATPREGTSSRASISWYGRDPAAGGGRGGRSGSALRGPHRRRRESETPPRASTPPASASSGGVSPRVGQATAIVIGGTRYVVTPRRPAGMRDSA